MEQALTEPKSEVIAKDFITKTGVDLRDYQRPEIVELIGDLVTFPLYAGKSLIIPLFIYLLITGVLAFVVTGYFSTILAIVFIPIFSVANALTTAAILFLFRLRNDITEAIKAGMDLSKEVTRDVRNVYVLKEHDALGFPSFAEIFRGVMHVVIVPITISVLKKKIPIIGGLFSGLVRKLANLTTSKTIKNLAEEHPEILDVDPPEDVEEATWIERSKKIENIADSTGKVISTSIKWASWALLAPFTISFGVVLAITIYCYWLIF